jgi:hypothetical protein
MSEKQPENERKQSMEDDAIRRAEITLRDQKKLRNEALTQLELIRQDMEEIRQTSHPDKEKVLTICLDTEKSLQAALEFFTVLVEKTKLEIEKAKAKKGL